MPGRVNRGLTRALAVLVSFMAALTLAPTRQAHAEDRRTGEPRFDSVAFFYGDRVPVDRLSHFDVAVVEPDAAFDPREHAGAGPQWFAYVSVGEVLANRNYFSAMPRRWLTGRNKDWDSAIVDQSARGWPAFFVRHAISPLAQRGFRGFFLDTLDSYQLIAKNEHDRARQRAGLVAVIRAIKKRYPDAHLILNRGFEILPEVHDLVSAVAFESLYGRWDQGNRQYGEVPQADRDWLLGQARAVRDRYGLPVVSIDYCPPEEPARCREIARKIAADGFVPYVTDGGLQTVGVGPGEAAAR